MLVSIQMYTVNLCRHPQILWRKKHEVLKYPLAALALIVTELYPQPQPSPWTVIIASISKVKMKLMMAAPRVKYCGLAVRALAGAGSVEECEENDSEYETYSETYSET